MAVYNNFTIIGRTTKDLEMKIKNNMQMCRLDIAVQQEKNKAYFFNVFVFDKIAVNCKNYLKKGDLVGISGYLKQIKDKNNYNQIILIGNSVKFLNNHKQEQNPKLDESVLWNE